MTVVLLLNMRRLLSLSANVHDAEDDMMLLPVNIIK